MLNLPEYPKGVLKILHGVATALACRATIVLLRLRPEGSFWQALWIIHIVCVAAVATIDLSPQPAAMMFAIVAASVLKKYSAPRKAKAAKQVVEQVAIGAVVDDLDKQTGWAHQNSKGIGGTVVSHHDVSTQKGSGLLQRTLEFALAH